MLRVEYIIGNEYGTIHFYNRKYFWIGQYLYKASGINKKPNNLSITIDYRQEAIDYLNSVGIDIKE